MNFQQSFFDFQLRLEAWMAEALRAPHSSPGEAPFAQFALELFRLQFGAVPVCQRLSRASGATPDSISDWAQIPALPAAAFKEFEVTALPADERSFCFRSSGTSSAGRSRHYHHARSLALYEKSLLPWFEAHVLGGERVEFDLLILAPAPDQAPRSSLAHMFDTVRRHFRPGRVQWLSQADAGGRWNLRPAALEALDNAARSSRPQLLLGTAFGFVHLLDACQRAQQVFSLPPGSRLMETGGYKGQSRTLEKSEFHRALSRCLGVPTEWIVCEYGMSELSSQAYDSVAGDPTTHRQRRFRFPPWARFQIISPETNRPAQPGEVGLLRITDLANVYSAACIQTEDLARACADDFELLGRAPAAEPRGCSLLESDRPRAPRDPNDAGFPNPPRDLAASRRGNRAALGRKRRTPF